MATKSVSNSFMRKPFVIFSIFLLIIVGAFIFVSGKTSHKLMADLDNERYGRILAEEKLEKANGEISGLETELKTYKDKNQEAIQVLQGGAVTTGAEIAPEAK